MLIHATSEKKLGPVIPLNCPACLEESVGGQSFAMVDQVLLLFVLPVHTRSTLFVSCGKCRRTFKPLVSLDALIAFPPAVRGQYLREHVSLWQILIALAALFFSWIPIIGVCLAGVALLVNWRASTWLRILSALSAIVGIVSTGIFAVLSA